MRDGVVSSRSLRLLLGVALACSVVVGCTDGASEDGTDGADGPRSAHAEAVAALTSLLPSDARGAFAVDLETLGADASSEVAALLDGEVAHAPFGEVFTAIGELAGSVERRDAITTAVLAQTTDPADGSFLLASLGAEAAGEELAGPGLEAAGTVGAEDLPVVETGDGTRATVLPGGLLVVGSEAVVASVVEVADGADAADGEEPAVAPFLEALDPASALTFAYGLPALYEDIAPDRTLRGAAAISGAVQLSDGSVGGTVAFHTTNAADFVESYNALDRNATGAEDAEEEPLALADPVVDGLGQVVVALPSRPIDASDEEALVSRNLVKKLFVGMEAHDYAEGVGDGNAALVDLLVKSERDEGTPPSPGSVFIRWEFRDRAAIEAFERDELPEGFTLAPTQFFESDDPEGGYFLALNLYNSGGGTIVNGMRAEWDVFVDPPEGADPDAGERPRFMIVDALGQAVSADPLNLVTPAEPLSHSFVDDTVVSSVRRLDGEREVPVFESRFPTPDPSTAEVARFTREMAIGNDYIYWPNGVYDRVVYNATTFNHDAYLVDPSGVTIRDDSRWAKYLKPEVKDVVYYVNTLEYVASPMANLDSEHLDVTPAWLEELEGFKGNGHQRAFMRGGVEQLFLGAGDALVRRRIANEVPSTTYSFEITDPEAMAEALDLPPDRQLLPTKVFEDGPEGHHLTLSVYEYDDALEGTRAEWSVTVAGADGRPRRLVVDALTADVGVDPDSFIALPDDVRHSVEDGVVQTRLSSRGLTFEASFAAAEATDEELSLDWIESGDDVCSLHGPCDQLFYDAETLDVPVHRPAQVEVATFTSPWSDLVDAEPVAVFYRDNPQELAIKRWHDLAVAVEELPVRGLEDGTHEITGSGSLVGRTSDVVDSTYTYTGDAIVEGDQLTFTLDQEVDNALGLSHIYTSGSFDLTTGTGSQTVVDCRGPDLMCSDIVRGSTALYTAQDLDASDPDAITWKVDVTVVLGGTFGTADSASTFTATRVG